MSEESKELFEKAKNMSLDEAYDYCLKLEYDREYSWRDSLQGSFESSMDSYDNLVDSFEDPSKIQILSDNGKGKENICASESAEAISVALSRLPRRDRPFAEAVLQGKTWREMGIPKRTFNWRLKKVEIFLTNIAHHPENSRLRLEGACDWRRLEITAKPPIRPTGSLRIALGERCFRDPTLQAALVRLTFQCMVGS